MAEEKLKINISSEKYNFVIQEKNISKIRVFYPFTSDISFDLKKDDNNYQLRAFDCKASYCAGEKEDVFYLETLIPFSNKIIIQVPMHYISNLHICAKYGNVFLKDLILDYAGLFSNSGKIVLNNCNVDSTVIDCLNSNVYLKNVSGDICAINTVNGNINVKYNIPDDTSITTYRGDVRTKFVEEDYDKMTLFIETHQKKVTQLVEPKKCIQQKLHIVTNHGRVLKHII